jgi:hypothetical protein
MRITKRILPALLSALLLMFSPMAALGEALELRSFVAQKKYQYVLFGTYPFDGDGARRGVIWRVLGVEDGVACLMTEYVIDYLQYHDVKDTNPDNPLHYADTIMRNTCNERCVNDLFTEKEAACLVEMGDGRGLLSVPALKELHNTDYGFKGGNFTVDVRRQARGTPYAYAKGLKKIHDTYNSWYWTTAWRRPGYRWIVGDNGHISVSGINREGGLRAVCYIKLDQLDALGGNGERQDPIHLSAK